MCGIAGLVCLGKSCLPDDHLPTVKQMCDIEVHRGPDDAGVVSLGDVCLGANRLSIIDLSPAGHMPMATSDNRWWIAYNGEVYNFQVLRDELVQQGHVFRSRTDTEVVLRAFAQWGTAALDRFVGMFACVIYNTHTRELTLFRDRFGKKPLYWTRRGGHLFFASELKVLTQLGGPLRVNQQRLAEWALYRTAEVGGPETLVEGIFSVPAGHCMRIVDGRREPPRAYYVPTAQVDVETWDRLARAPAGAVLEEVGDALATAVRDRLVSDVRLGTLCSGGVDSSLVTALCARHMPGVAAFHVALDGYRALDESRYASAVAKWLGIELLVCPLTAEAYREHLTRATYHSDAPLAHANSVAFMLVSEFARTRGVSILLSGEGADELFGGYPHRYRRYRQLVRARRVLGHLPARVQKALLLGGWAVAGLPATRCSDYDGLIAYALAFVDRFSREGIHQRCREAYAFVPDAMDRALLAEMLADLSTFLPALLRRLDRMSMASSVECRVPFLDHRFVDLVINLPLRYRLRGTTDKWLLKAIAARHLPPSIVFRRKRGFPLPLADYVGPLARINFFRDGFCEQVLGMDRRGLEMAIGAWRENVQGLFSLLALEIWGRMFLDGQRPEEVSDQLLQGVPVERRTLRGGSTMSSPGGSTPWPRPAPSPSPSAAGWSRRLRALWRRHVPAAGRDGRSAPHPWPHHHAHAGGAGREERGRPGCARIVTACLARPVRSILSALGLIAPLC